MTDELSGRGFDLVEYDLVVDCSCIFETCLVENAISIFFVSFFIAFTSFLYYY